MYTYALLKVLYVCTCVTMYVCTYIRTYVGCNSNKLSTTGGGTISYQNIFSWTFLWRDSKNWDSHMPPCPPGFVVYELFYIFK